MCIRDRAFTGNVPVAAGLSSSSSIVVATAEAFLALNNIDLSPQKFVDLCGEGEWYVGSRGGAADHAAMKFGEKGYIVRLSFLPFQFESMYKFPEGYKLIIANSHIKANKTTNSKDDYNSRIAAYEFGLMMLKDKYPNYIETIQHLRDINSEKLKLPPSKIYQMLLELPEKITAGEVYELISSGYHKNIKRILSSHNSPQYYHIRPIVLYGIAECYRARLCKEYLEKGRIEEFGVLMNVSHDGDRIVYYNDEGNMTKFDWSLPDIKLEKLIDDLKSESPERVMRAQIEMQSGGYACSTPEIDYMVHLAKKVPGVIGAQLSGAGLGGCIMVLVREESIDSLISILQKDYYEPRGLNPDTLVCAPVKGSLVLEC